MLRRYSHGICWMVLVVVMHSHHIPLVNWWNRRVEDPDTRSNLIERYCTVFFPLATAAGLWL